MRIDETMVGAAEETLDYTKRRSERGYRSTVCRYAVT